MFGDIVLCEFPFTSGKTAKVRPALVLFELSSDVIICRITSVLYDGPNDVLLRDWKGAGLLKPSVARLDRIVTAERVIILRTLGALSIDDQHLVREAWNSAMRL